MFSMFLDVCKNFINYSGKLWISIGGGPVEIRMGIYSWYNPTIFLRFNVISVCIKKTIIILICLCENRSLIFIYHWYLIEIYNLLQQHQPVAHDKTGDQVFTVCYTHPPLVCKINIACKGSSLRTRHMKSTPNVCG